MKEIGVGLLGFGTVGAGVVECLQNNGDVIAERLGARLVLRKIADVDLVKDRGVKVPAGVLIKDAAAVIADPQVQVVVELIGGTGVARKFVTMALEAGKSVVTANKALLAKHGAELFKIAEEHNADIHFGASVGGGIPIIRTLRSGLIANHVNSMYGILNGTCNYILTRMEQEKLPFDKALAEAQAAGYAEANPSLDIDGHDTAHKATILASMAYGPVSLDHVYVEGIGSLTDVDIQYALDFGYRIKLLAVIKNIDGKVEVRVHPTMVPLGHMLASVNGVFNAVMVDCDFAGRTLYYGRGAGRAPTASTVLSDIADVAKNLMVKAPRRFPVLQYTLKPPVMRPMGEITSRYYLRLALKNQAGVLAKITALLGEQDISIASVLQKEIGTGAHVPVVILTHKASEAACNTALQKIDALDVVGAKTIKLRIED
jgi:homoserine dehydrogenase